MFINLLLTRLRPPFRGPAGWSRGVLCGIAASLAACGEQGGPPGGLSRSSKLIQHPAAEFVDTTLPISFSVPLEAEGGTAQVPWTLGTVIGRSLESGARELVIGRIYKLLRGPRDQVLVVDDLSNVVRVYDALGGVEGSVGRAGQGPGDFRRPLAAAFDRAGRLYVSDTNRRLQVFTRDGGGFKYAKSLDIGIIAQDLCFLGDTLVVQATSLTDPAILHFYDDTGHRLTSFGALYRSPSPDMNEEFGIGRVACDAQSQMVYYAPLSGVGEVRAYTAAGVPAWRTTFTGFRANRWTSQAATITVRLSKEGAHSLAAIQVVPGDGLLVQWTYLSWQEMEDLENYGMTWSFLLDPATGRPIALGASLPVLPVVGESSAVTAFEDPEPRFEVRALTRH